jgi:hypothetical protein
MGCPHCYSYYTPFWGDCHEGSEGVRKWGSIFAPVRSGKGTSCKSEKRRSSEDYSNPPSPQPSPPLSLITRQFWGELEVRQILPPSYRFPPRAGGTKQRFPLRSRGNLTEGVLKKCRAMSLEQGGRGYGSGGILPAKSRFGAPNKGGWCIPLSETTQGKLFFEHPRPLKVFENAVFAPLLQVPPTQWGEPKRLGSLAKFPPLCEGNQKGSVPLPAGFPYCVRGTRKARFPLPAGGTYRRG